MAGERANAAMTERNRPQQTTGGSLALPAEMRAMVFDGPGRPLKPVRLPVPRPGDGEVLIRVDVCGVCRTDLHLVDGELPDPLPAVIPGHEIVGRIVAVGARVAALGFPHLQPGGRVGVGWLAATCGLCRFCREGHENLCERALFTGYTHHGGYAEYHLADAGFVYPLDVALDDAHAAPLLCAGLIGYRSYRMIGDALVVGLYGFGAAAHILCQLMVAEGRRVHAFTRPGDQAAQAFARRLGAVWAGDSTEMPPEPLDAALIFAPVGALVPAALKAVRPGGRVICGGIHMSDIPGFAYRDLWAERTIQSVANLTRADADAFLGRARQLSLATHVTPFGLEEANAALDALRRGQLQGAAVLVIGEGEDR